MRDATKSRVYDAESRLRWMYDNIATSGNPTVDLGVMSLTLEPEARFASLASIQSYVNTVTRMPSVTDTFGHQGTVTVRTRKGDTCAHYEPASMVIAVPDARWAMRETVVLHELAHHYNHDGPSHGDRFVATFSELLSTVMGPQTGLALRILIGRT